MDTPAIKDIKTPFTPYDVLAYLIPGLTCVGSIAYYEFVLAQHVPAEKLHAPFQHVGEWVESLHCGPDSGASWALQFLLLLGCVAALYVVGHIIASLSEICLDRILVHKATGYPREKLLELHDKSGREISRPFYKGTFFWFNVVAFSCYCAVLVPAQYRIWLHYGIRWMTYAMLAVFAVKVVTSWLSPPRNEVELWFRSTWVWRSIKWSIIFTLTYIYAGPVKIVSSLYNDLIQPKRGFDDSFLAMFRVKFKDVFGMDAETSLSNTYWLPYIYVAEKSETMNRILINWLNLYSFMRNLAMAFYLAFIYTALSLSVEGHNLPKGQGLCAIYLPAALFGLSMISLLRFYYLYSAYYTKFLYRAFVFLVTHSDADADADEVPQPERALLTRTHIFGRSRRH